MIISFSDVACSECRVRLMSPSCCCISCSRDLLCALLLCNLSGPAEHPELTELFILVTNLFRLLAISCDNGSMLPALSFLSLHPCPQLSLATLYPLPSSISWILSINMNHFGLVLLIK